MIFKDPFNFQLNHPIQLSISSLPHSNSRHQYNYLQQNPKLQFIIWFEQKKITQDLSVIHHRSWNKITTKVPNWELKALERIWVSDGGFWWWFWVCVFVERIWVFDGDGDYILIGFVGVLRFRWVLFLPFLVWIESSY